MTEFQVVEGRPYHCGQVARRLRQEHLRAILAMGADPHLEIRRRFFESSYRRAWLIDGELAALGGLTGSIMEAEGVVWLAVTEAGMRHSHAMVREAKRQLEMLMATKRRLAAYLLGGDQRAVHLAVYLGFHPEGGAASASRAGRMFAVKNLDAIPEKRIPVGGNYAFRVIYGERGT